MPLELRFGEAIEDCSVRSKYLCDGQPNERTDFCTAKYWRKRDTLGEGGPDYAEATRRRLFCAFGPKSTDLEDEKLRAAMYPEVVEDLMMGEGAFELVCVDDKET